MAPKQAPWPVIPKDAIEYFRRAFAEANRVATEHIVNVPNIRETSLDDVLVNALIPFSSPKRLQSGAVVEMDIHNIGGLRHVYPLGNRRHRGPCLHLSWTADGSSKNRHASNEATVSEKQ
jgi:hypothetical protein